ncbi:DUF1134 domain-containing protein [Gammaproteobacteria bacterium]
MNHSFVSFFFMFSLLVTAPLLAEPATTAPILTSEQGYEQRTIEEEASAFFGEASEGLAKALEEAFKVRGKPSAYIKGQEVGLSLTFGVRYGDGIMKFYGSDEGNKIFWQGPSIGFDQGLNCSKVFILVYNLPEASDIFRGFPGLETNLYYYAGISVTYLEGSNIILIPIRLGMGLRTGVNIGYLRFSRAPSWNPF